MLLATAKGQKFNITFIIRSQRVTFSTLNLLVNVLVPSVFYLFLFCIYFFSSFAALAFGFLFKFEFSLKMLIFRYFECKCNFGNGLLVTTRCSLYHSSTSHVWIHSEKTLFTEHSLCAHYDTILQYIYYSKWTWWPCITTINITLIVHMGCASMCRCVYALTHYDLKES